jgi:hypothetical protein
MMWYLGKVFVDLNANTSEEVLQAFHPFLNIFRLRENDYDVLGGDIALVITLFKQGSKRFSFLPPLLRNTHPCPPNDSTNYYLNTGGGSIGAPS